MSAQASHRWALPDAQRPQPLDLRGVPAVRTGRTRQRSWAVRFVDTDDLRLARWGCSLSQTDDGDWALHVDGSGRGPHLLAPVLRFRNGRQPPIEACDLVTALIRGGRLGPVLRARVDERTVVLRARDGDFSVAVVEARTTALEGRRIAARLRDISLESEDELPEPLRAAIESVVVAAGGAVLPELSLPARALGERATEAPDVVLPETTRRVSARLAIQHAIAASVQRLLLHDAAVRIGRDPEGVHQARVATRRLRSDLRTFRPLLSRDWVGRLRDELHHLADLLGAVRDADVLLERLRQKAATLPENDRREAERAFVALAGRRDAARVELLGELRSPSYVRLLDDLVDAARAPQTTLEAEDAAAKLLPSLARTSWRRLRARVRELPAEPADAELHEVRILAKRARYAAEAVAPVSRRAVTVFAKAVAALQDGLGEHHDAVVAEAWLRGAAEPGSGSLVIGTLIGLERAAAAEARAAWPELWAATVRAHPRAWT